MANKITVLLDLVTDKATSAARGFKASVAEAEGSLGKLRAGASSAFGSLSALAGPALIGAGTAIAAFGVKAVGAFTDTAKAAIDLSTATGLSIEAASRWIAVGDDYQVSADALATGLGKVAKTLDDTKWSDYGIATRDAAGQARNANDILLDAFSTLSSIANETERAHAGQVLFGKGYQSLTPILGHTRAEYEKMLAAQMDGQVVTAQEAQKAEDARLALDNLHDSMQEITLAIGQLLSPAVAELADDLAGLAQGAVDAGNAIESVPGLPELLKKWNPVTGFLGTIKEGIDFVSESWHGAGEAASGSFATMQSETDRTGRNIIAGVDGIAGAVGGLADAVGELGPRWSAASIPLEAASGAFAEMRSHADELADSTRDTGDAASDAADDWNVFEDGLRKAGDQVDFITGKINDLRGVIDLGAELDDISQGFDNIIEAQKDLTDGGEDAARKFRDQIRLQQNNLLDLLETMKDIPAEKRAKIIAEIAQGDLDSLNAALDDIVGKDRFVHVGLVMPNIQQAFQGLNVAIPAGDMGGAPSINLTGLNPAPNNSQTTIIYPVGSSPTTGFIDQRLYQNRNGTNPR